MYCIISVKIVFSHGMFPGLLKINHSGDCGYNWWIHTGEYNMKTLKLCKEILNYIRPNIHTRHNTGIHTHTQAHTHKHTHTEWWVHSSFKAERKLWPRTAD